jgi:DNA-directed RNA polymerase alpha subunit
MTEQFHQKGTKKAAPSDRVARSSLPRWVVSALRTSGIRRFSTLARLNDREVLAIPGIGKRALSLIRMEMDALASPAPHERPDQHEAKR